MWFFSKSGKKLSWLFEASFFFPCFRDCVSFLCSLLFFFGNTRLMEERDTHHSSYIVHINTAFGWRFYLPQCHLVVPQTLVDSDLLRGTIEWLVACRSLLSFPYYLCWISPHFHFTHLFFFWEECIYLFGFFLCIWAFTSLGDGRSEDRQVRVWLNPLTYLFWRKERYYFHLLLVYMML